MVQYNLIVKRSKNCKSLLVFIDDNIETINELGAVVKITVIGDDDGEKLAKIAVTHLPTVITPSGKKVVGGANIRQIFIDKIKKANEHLESMASSKKPAAGSGSTAGRGAEFGNNPDMSAIYAEEMRPEKIKEDQENDGGVDFASAMRRAEERSPRHRSAVFTHSRRNIYDDDPRDTRDNRGERDTRDNNNRGGEYDYNSDENEPPRGRGNAPPRGGKPRYNITQSMDAIKEGNGYDKDSELQEAWLNNNVSVD